MATTRHKDIQELAVEISKSSKDKPVEHILQTSERVLKRITDGIYRQPSSALRELISNSYDADATKVVIETDRPRFSKITIRDNGNGFTYEALASLICSIGGSPKRTLDGSDMGVTKKDDPDLSPDGRKLIGKIGIGLFAVSQLTKEFQIITKTKGSDHRVIAHVILKTHSEEELKQEVGREFETGKARIWRKKATDTNSHGTEVILLKLLQKTKADLASDDRWVQSYSNSFLVDEGDELLPSPKYHIGCVVNDDENKIRQKPNLPWENNDTPKNKFKKLIKSVHDETGVSTQNPKLEELLDNYLKLLWTLGLQVPVPYIDIHPFEICEKDRIHVYNVGDKPKSRAKRITLKNKETIAENMKLNASHLQQDAGKFDVFIDGVQVFRPLLYETAHLTQHAIKNSLMFVGKSKPDMGNIPEEIRGGDLEFEAYLFWQPKVVPVEHRGVLVRINNSNGTLFDETFMKYPVSEQTRKNQIVSEIFVLKGMDAALNIDRESFNYAHPHYQYITKWLHNAFKQFATAHKKIGRETRDELLMNETATKSNKLDDYVAKEIRQIKPDAEVAPVKVEFSDEPLLEITAGRKTGKLIYNAKKVFPFSPDERSTSKRLLGNLFFEERLKAIAEVLAAYGVFDDMPFKKQEELLRTIAKIIKFEE